MDDLPKQEPLKQPATSGKAIPDPITNFGDDGFDYNAMPQKRFSIGRFNDWIFSKMRPKSKSAKVTVKPKKIESEIIDEVISNPNAAVVFNAPIQDHKLPSGYTIENGLLLQKKSLAERVRDQIKFPVLKSSRSIINGAALILFAVGAIVIYSELPTHPELVVGILIVAISANIIMSNR